MAADKIPASQPPQGCFESLQRCIDALCADQSKGRAAIDWAKRRPDLDDFYFLEDNMTPPSANASWYEADDWVRGSMKNGSSKWASNNNFGSAYSCRDCTPAEKANLRHTVAKDYLADHPDDCQPPAPPPSPQPARQRMRAPAATQLPLFPELTAFSPVYGFDAEWLLPSIAIGALATAATEALSSAAEGVFAYAPRFGSACLGGPAIFTVGLRYFEFKKEKTPIL